MLIESPPEPLLMHTNGTHRPNAGNHLAPYFPKATIRKCGKDVRRILAHFPPLVIEALILRLKKREVTGSLSQSDLIGTIARVLTQSSEDVTVLAKRREIYDKLGLACTPEYLYDFEWWFAQISARSSLGKNVPRHRCVFTETTIHWCRETIAHHASIKKGEEGVEWVI